eukprot:222582-Chlamydomonas_euryale.AAC.6
MGQLMPLTCNTLFSTDIAVIWHSTNNGNTSHGLPPPELLFLWCSNPAGMAAMCMGRVLSPMSDSQRDDRPCVS